MRLLFLILFPILSIAQPTYKVDIEEDIKPENVHHVINAAALHSEGWSKLPQPIFWKQVMTLSPDSCLINVASSRVIIQKMSLIDYDKMSNDEKNAFRDSIRTANNLAKDERIFRTIGKNDFFKFDKVYPTLIDGVIEFGNNGVDSWYAQAILLIESPGQMKKSRVGAYGPFQLMPAVARAQGLIVNRSIDERSDFKRSAYGSSQLIKRVCIPEAKKILDAQNITYKETDIWFRLFVLHVYHAGAMNVKAVVNLINPSEGGQELIKAMWQNTAAQFGNNSQNYSQLALASQLIISELKQ
ncbi:MAG TPA: lytic transglycosylase domain-containing protein [Crocinitomicaceae bacterium]|nr:lytic transglycosylase domain-containing protein [Crocinitomicaceae bacterium]